MQTEVIFDNKFELVVKFYQKPVKPNFYAHLDPKTMSVDSILSSLANQKICQGVSDPSLVSLADFSESETDSPYFRQVIGLEQNSIASVARSKKCSLFLNSYSNKEMCTNCNYSSSLLARRKHRKENPLPISKHHPLHCASKESLITAYKALRKREQELEERLEKFSKEIEEDSENVTVSTSLHETLSKIIDDNKGVSELADMFWQEQKKAFSRKPKGMRWHPQMIRLAIFLHCRSPSAYRSLQETGILKLPNESTLRDYTHVFHPRVGFSPAAIADLKDQAKDFSPEERFVVLLHDEMSIRKDLVFDRVSGEVIGFVNPHKLQQEEVSEYLASHVMVFYVVGLNTHIKASLGFFPTRSATAGEIFPKLWKAISYLEMICGLKVIGSTSDKASFNQKLYQLHELPDKSTSVEGVCYKARNIYALDRFVYFISDAPHLIKTIRNNVLNSGSGRKTNILWNGKDIVWSHIRRLYSLDNRPDQDLRRTKLRHEHVFPGPSGQMNVKLAAQVFSTRTATAMHALVGDIASATTELLFKVDRFFDLMNTRSDAEACRLLKPDLQPYKSADDGRFDVLSDFLGYLQAWRQNTLTRPGNFSPKDRSRMFLTHQTYKGILMTVTSFCEATKYLLTFGGLPKVKSRDFCQDPLEQHFGRHRAIGRRCDNPSVKEFANNENILREQRATAHYLQPKGNVAPRERDPEERGDGGGRMNKRRR